MKQFELSGTIWERVRQRNPYDLEANLSLGTIYQRLGDLGRIQPGPDRALNSPKLAPADRAEAHALRARNAKQLWQNKWSQARPEDQPAEALHSKQLMESYREYAKGFEDYQNHFYSGLNALAMLTVVVELASALPAVWTDLFDDDDGAAQELSKLRQKRQRLAGAVECSLEAAQQRAIRLNKPDPWLEASVADLRCLTSTKPERVASAVPHRGGRAQELQPRFGSQATGALPPPQTIDRKRRRSPGPARMGFNGRSKRRSGAGPRPRHCVHRAPHRQSNPPGAAVSPEQRGRSPRPNPREALAAPRGDQGSGRAGIGGGASGGDILFHEVCAELGIPTGLYLAVPADAFCAASVRDAGPEWERRFYALVQKHPELRVLAETEELPAWLRSRRGMTFGSGITFGSCITPWPRQDGI